MPDTVNDRYRYGARLIRSRPVAATETIEAGDFLDLTGGYLQVATAGDIPIGVALETVTGGSSSGDVSCLVDLSEQSVYEYPPDAGTVALSIVGDTCDIGGSQSINIDASADDCIVVHDIDTDANTCFISILPIRPGVA